jgi:hypothetical protein
MVLVFDAAIGWASEVIKMVANTDAIPSISLKVDDGTNWDSNPKYGLYKSIS